jgi:hypothetical protein
MKKNLLTAIAVFLFTFVILLVVNEVPDENNELAHSSYIVSEN